MKDFSNIDYLKIGNQRQIQAFKVLTEKKIVMNLAEFYPVLVGTIPINIDIETSDLDIICYWKDKMAFRKKIQSNFNNEDKFIIRDTFINNQETVIASFETAGFKIEVFGQNIPVREQNGYRHMITEYEILQSKGENFRREIIKLKQQGYKTEPAFGLLLGLKGDPYSALLDYKI